MSDKGREAERRRYRRYPVDLDVRVTNQASGHAIDGQVHDLCLGGALLVNLEEDWLKATPAESAIELTLTAPDAAERPLVVQARVVRVLPSAAGVAFVQPGAISREQLQRLITAEATDETLATAVPAGVPETGRARVILDRMMATRGEEILDVWLQAVEESLWQQAERADTATLRQKTGDDAVCFSQLLRVEGGRGLRDSLLQGSPAVGGVMNQADTDTAGLALVDRENFETWLESSLLVSHLEGDLGSLLRILDSQLISAFGDNDRLALLPAKLAGAFDAWAGSHDLSGRVRRIAMQGGRRVLPRLLGGYYRDLSRALEEIGFAPVDIPRRWQKPQRTAVRSAASAAAESQHASAEAGVGPSDTAASGGTHGAGRSDVAELTSSQAAELLMALPTDALCQTGDEATGRSLKERSLGLLAGMMPSISSQPLEARLNQRIEATDRVLNHIVRNASSSPQTREWAERLSVRMLAASVADENFFKAPGHPLLQILGQLDRLAMFLPDAAEADATVHGDIETLVGQVLAIDVRDAEAYQPLMSQLQELGRQLGEHFRQDAQRAIQRLEGQERRHQAHAHVQQQLAARLAGQRVHRAVAELLDSAWATLLELHYLREGADGAEQQRAWSLLLQLHALCGGEGQLDGLDIRDLDNELMAGLAYVGFDPFQAKGMMQQVRDAVRRHRAGLSGEDDYLIYRLPAATAEEGEAIEGIEPGVLARLVSQIDAVQLGTGLRCRKDGDEQPRRLVWRSADGMLFAFLDGRSGEVRPYSRNELLNGLYSGLLQLLDSPAEGIAEQALDATLREMQERLRYHENRDGLTGLHTQQQFIGRLAQLLEGDGQHDPHAVGFLDIDHFEAMTGACGYKAGEQLLQALSRLLQQQLGEGDFLAFMGGRRFAFVLQGLEVEHARATGEQLLREIYALPFAWQGRSYPVTGSLGIASLQAGRGDPDALLSAVSVACTVAQEAGGNRLVVFSEDDAVIGRQRDRLRWLSLVEDVIKGERIRLRVQTIAPLDSGSGLTGHHEVLMSVYDAQGEMLELGPFIAAAEAFNLMGKVDRLVIRKALHWASAHPERLAGLGGLAINLSGLSLSDPGMLGFIREQLAAHGVAPGRISFEVTETAAIASLEHAVSVIEGIKEIGCEVALDDFGTGMSSYGYLKSMPVDYVKIDGSFIRDLPDNPHDMAIVRSINEIAHFMGMRTIAEFVENEQICEQLREFGVDFVQGYAIQRPCFLDEMFAG